MLASGSRRERRAALVASLITLALPTAAGAQEQQAGRGLLGGVVSGVTSTLDGAVVSVSDATGGAVSLPSTGQLTSTVSGTLEVVGDAVSGTVAPVTDGVAQVTLAVPGLSSVDGAAVLGLVVGNSGDRACTPLLAVAITGADGVAVSSGESQLSQLAPHSSSQFVLPWPGGLGSGDYGVKATASDCGLPQTVALSVRLEAQVGTTGSGGTNGSGGSGSGGSGSGPGGSGSGGSGAGASGSGGAAGSGGSASGDAHGSNASGGGNSGGYSHADQLDAATSSGASTGAPTAVTPAAAQQAGRRQSDRGRARQIGRLGDGSSMLVGPPAPAARVRRAGVERVAGVRGGASAQPSTSGAALPSTLEGAVQAIPAVLERAAPALIVLGLIGAMFLLQEAAARRDPKLALAPVHADDDLDFAEPGAFLRRLAGGPPGLGGGPPTAT